jgi:predicted dehydrogenase
MATLGFGVIGVGSMGRRHADHLAARVPGARLVAVADTNTTLAQSVAEAYTSASGHTVTAYADLDSLLASPDVEAVVIAGPAGVHATQVELAAKAGKQIFCEKPLALTVDQALAAVMAAKQANVALQIGFMRRYDPGYADAMRMIQAGEIGRPVLFKATSRDPLVPPLHFLRSPLNAGLFLDSAIHDFDLARWLMSNEVARLSAFGSALVSNDVREAGGLDSAVVNLQYRNNAFGNVECYWHATYGYDIRTEVVGEQGTLFIGAQRQRPVTVLTKSGSKHDVVQEYLVRFEEAYLLEMCDFAARVASGRPPVINGDDGIRSVAICLAAATSAASGGEVTAVEA